MQSASHALVPVVLDNLTRVEFFRIVQNNWKLVCSLLGVFRRGDQEGDVPVAIRVSEGGDRGARRMRTDVACEPEEPALS